MAWHTGADRRAVLGGLVGGLAAVPFAGPAIAALDHAAVLSTYPSTMTAPPTS
jgi:hypothetical protein